MTGTDEAERVANALKPPRCPKCGAEIDHLRYYAYELQRADFWICHGYAEYDNWDTVGDIKGKPDYECPNCGEPLFHSEDKAEEFLRGE